MRGTPKPEINIAPPKGITPAHAGNTNSNLEYGIDFKDHPRPCGEHNGLSRFRFLFLGSPPPMRGTH